MTATASRLGAIAALVGLGLLIAACGARASGTPEGSAAPTGAVSSPAALVGTAPPPPASVATPTPSTTTTPSAGPTRPTATPDLRPIEGLLGQLDAALSSADAAAVPEGSAP